MQTDRQAFPGRRGCDRPQWDAVRQLIRYREIVGGSTPLSAESIRNGAFILDTPAASE